MYTPASGKKAEGTRITDHTKFYKYNDAKNYLPTDAVECSLPQQRPCRTKFRL